MKMPFGQHRGAELESVPDDYLAWLTELPAFEVRSLSETRKETLRAAVVTELQRRLDARPELLALILERAMRDSGGAVPTLH